jgi:nicotinamidase-related amidase
MISASKRLLQQRSVKKLITTGIILEVCLAALAITAVHKGYEVHAVIDAAGTFSVMREELEVTRMVHAGVKCVGCSNILVELLLLAKATRSAYCPYYLRDVIDLFT